MSDHVARARTCRLGVARAVPVVPRVAGVVLALALVSTLPGGSAQSAAREPYERAPNLAEYSLLALVNMSRAEPSLDGLGNERPVPPLVWNDALAEAARYHVHDEIEHGCYSHDSCNGQKWSTRISRWYPGWWALGENITIGGTPYAMHRDWMASPGHRSNVLSPNYREFGPGVDVNWNGANFQYGVEDFGARGTAPAIPVIPAATVLHPRTYPGTGTWDWEMLVNYYDPSRAPTKVEAVVDGQRRPLTHFAGTTKHGSWHGFIDTAPFPQDCKLVHFEVTSTAGTYRWPASGEIRIGKYAPGSCFDPYGPADFTGAPPVTTTTAGNPTTTTTVAPPPPGSAPTVVIDAPAPGNVSGTVEIRAHATEDEDGNVGTASVLVNK